MKPKLFLNSTDVADITGYTQRNARNIMEWIRTEKGLGKRQAISIYDFCESFNLPLDVVFKYINSKDFNVLPIDEDSLRKNRSNTPDASLQKNPKYLYSKDFEPLISKGSTSKEEGDQFYNQAKDVG